MRVHNSRIVRVMARRAVVLGGVALASISLSATTKGPDAGGYSATDSAVYSYVDVSGSNGGVFFHTGPQSQFLKKGYEAQVCNSCGDKRKTG